MDAAVQKIFGSYKSWKYDEGTWIINFMEGTQNIYLLEGDNHALLIDTGWGTGNLRAYVERLTSKPVLVINTHGHLDHSGGNGEWERVMMLPSAESDLVTLEHGPCDISLLPHPDYIREFVSDGQVLDLGGREIELMEISSHSNGSVALLDRSHRLLFVGDELESAQVLMYEVEPRPDRPAFVLDSRLQRHHANMLRLKARSAEWDAVFPAHNGAPIAHSYLDDYIGLVEHIYQGDAVIEDKLNHVHAEAGDPEHKLCRVRWRKASFFVVKENLKALYGTCML